jgi:ABC-type nitrate/sulfonate/bicarbonate transport system substrate-binding protein
MKAVVAALAAFLAALPAHAAEKLPVGKAALTSSAVLPIDIGVKTGIFAKHDLDVEIVVFQGAAKMHQAMLAGSVDLGIGGGPEMALIAKGAPELAVCNVAPAVAFLGILVPADSPIRDVAGLKGKKIAVAAVGGLAYWLTLELERREGWGPQGMEIVEIGNNPASVVAALKTHAVDAAYTGTVLAFTMEEEGTGRLLIPASHYAGHVGASLPAGSRPSPICARIATRASRSSARSPTHLPRCRARNSISISARSRAIAGSMPRRWRI